MKSSDELNRLGEKKRIKNEAYATRLKLQRKDKERGEKSKRNKKNESFSTIQAIGGGGPFVPAAAKASRDKSKSKQRARARTRAKANMISVERKGRRVIVTVPAATVRAAAAVRQLQQ